MKTIVLYHSSTGFTQQYAQWIAGRLGCSAIRTKEASGTLSQYDAVIYGGNVMAGLIVGLGPVLKENPKSLVVFAVGFTPRGDALSARLRQDNQLPENVPLFYFEGGLRRERLSLPKKLILSMVRRSLSKKEALTPEERELVRRMSSSVDCSSQEQIQPLVELFSPNS